MYIQIKRDDFRSCLCFDNIGSYEKCINTKISPLNDQDVSLTIYDKEMSNIGKVRIVFYNIYEYLQKRSCTFNSEETSPSCLASVFNAFCIGRIAFKKLSARPYIAALDYLYINPQFRGKGIGNWLIKNIEKLADYYNSVSICGIITFPDVAEEHQKEGDKWIVDRTNATYQQIVGVLEKNGFEEITDTNYFFKRCEENS